MNLPETVVKCDGCEKDLNLLGVHLKVQVKAERTQIVAQPIPAA